MNIPIDIQKLKDKEKSRSKLVKELKKITFEQYIDSRDVINDDFFFFSAYEFFMDKQKREQTGAVYTPEWIAAYMCDITLQKWLTNNKDLWNIKVLDPCSGSGNYTHIMIDKLKTLFIEHYPHKNEQEILQQIINHCVYSWDINEEALEICSDRINAIFNTTYSNASYKNTLFEKNIEFDIVIGNPPYGDLLNATEKSQLNDAYNNIALNFIDWSLKSIKLTGEVCFIVPHSFTRVKSYTKWREKIYQQKNLHKIVDVGNPFYDITLEEVIYCFNKAQNNEITSLSFKHNDYYQKININDFYDKQFNYKMVIYWDDFFNIMRNNKLSFPFSGKRGHDISKKNLDKQSRESNLWLILGKNIEKNNTKHIENYDCYIDKSLLKKNLIIDTPVVAITQFGTNLKAALLNSQTYPSGGVVIVNHHNLSQDQTLSYLNNAAINYYLKRYVFNDADLTVHIDGIYLAEIPYVTENVLTTALEAININNK